MAHRRSICRTLAILLAGALAVGGLAAAAPAAYADEAGAAQSQVAPQEAGAGAENGTAPQEQPTESAEPADPAGPDTAEPDTAEEAPAEVPSESPEEVQSEPDLSAAAPPGGAPSVTARAPASDDDEPAVGEFRWGVRQSFLSYVEGPIAHGAIEVTAPATRDGGVFAFPQTSKDWEADAEPGSAAFGGAIRFTGHDGVLDLTLANPTVEILDPAHATLSVDYRTWNQAAEQWETKSSVMAELDLAAGTRSEADGAVTWTEVPAKLTPAGVKDVFQDYLQEDSELDTVAFTVGADSGEQPVDVREGDDGGETPPVKPEPKPKPKPSKPVSGARAAGSLAWGISSAFAAYTTGNIAKGSVSSSGVGRSGSAYLFPQAVGGNWNFGTQTGTVRYSGVVTFSGHHGLMNEVFANPVITVTSASSGTISAGGRVFGLNLAAASKSVGSGGAVTWSNVPVSGVISGGGNGGGGSLGVDPLSFTVGAVSNVNFGSTAVSHPSVDRGPAAEPPATTGISLLTPPDELVAGGEIEFEAAGFEPGEREILVVMYSEPVVLDRNAGADENGVVRWIGTLPKNLHGEHTITLQGSIDAGAVVDIMTQEEYEAAQAAGEDVVVAEAGEDLETRAAGPAVSEGTPAWVLWAGAIGLLVVAAGMTGLVVAQRRRAEAA